MQKSNSIQTAQKKAVVLLSGGMDSATCGAIALAEGYEIYALSFEYGQRHRFELQAARTIARLLAAVEHKILSIDLRAFGGSSLTEAMPVPKNRSVDGSVPQGRTEIPDTYVPARNTIFLAHALAWAEVLKSRDIFIGVTAVDYSGYPDCRPEFIAAFEKTANLATRAGVEGNRLTIHTPLIALSKADIVKTGMALKVDFSLTHSCYDPSSEGFACGECDSCLLRKKGFREAGVEDPTRYKRLA